MPQFHGKERTAKAVGKYGLTSCLLYTLAQLGFKIDILAFGMNVVMDVVNLAGELADGAKEDDGVGTIDLSESCSMEG